MLNVDVEGIVNKIQLMLKELSMMVILKECSSRRVCKYQIDRPKKFREFYTIVMTHFDQCSIFMLQLNRWGAETSTQLF